MATRTGSVLSLAELTKRRDPDGDAAKIAEVIAESNPIMDDIPWMEANNVESHKVLRRASQSSGGFRRINDGVPNVATDTEEFIEQLAMLEAYSQIDIQYLVMSPNTNEARFQEAKGIIQGMAENWVDTLFYGNQATDSEQFTGLSPRLGTTSNWVIDEGGTGSDVTSIYIVQWGLDKVSMAYPKGDPNFGITRDDKGEERVAGITAGTFFQAMVEHYKIHGGLVITDPRSIGRLANIESSGSSNIFDEDNLISILNQFRGDMSTVRMYCNRTIKTQMDIRLKDKANVNFSTAEGLGGVDVLQFKQVPVIVCDAIIDTEDAI